MVYLQFKTYNMKKILLTSIIIFLLGVSNAFSQSIEKPLAVVTYTVKKETSFLGMYECQLVFDKKASVFTWQKTGDQSIKRDAKGMMYKADASMHGVINYTNFEDQKLISKLKIDYVEQRHLVEEPLTNIKWEITNQQKELSGYTVTKATTSFRGRDYTAWFTNKIPVKAGPWKLQGLPGLILEAYDTEQEIYFAAKKITKTTDSISITEEFKNHPTIDLITYYKRTINEPFEAVKRQNAKNKRGGVLQITGINYNFLEKSFEYLGKEREAQVNK